MRFTATQADLAAGLATAARAVSNRNPMPILSGVMLKASDQSVTILATDLSVAIETAIPADVSEPGAVVLPARYFTEIVRRVPAGPVSVSIDQVTHTATLQWDKSRFTVHGQAADHFPPSVLPDREADYRLPQARLRDLIRETVFAVSEDITRPVLTGVNVIFAPPAITLLATDSFRMVRSRGEVQSLGGEEHGTAVLPARTLQELARLLGDTDADVTVYMSDRQVAFDLGHVRLFTRVLDGEFPTEAITRLVESATATTTARVPLGHIHDACERAALIVRGETDQIKLDVTANEMAILATAAEIGQVYEEIAAAVDGDKLEIYLNPQLVLEGLRSLTTDDIVFEFTGTRTAVRIKKGEGDDFLYAVMPQAAPAT